MSEPMFPGGAAPAAPAEADVETTPSNRKALMALGGVVGALVLGGGVFLLMNSSSSQETVSGVIPGARPSSAAKPAVSTAPKPVVVKSTTVKVSSRDPFKSVVIVPVVAAAPAVAPTPATTGPVTSPTAPTTPTTPSVSLSVTAVDPVAETAALTVNGKKYTVSVGQDFGKYFTLYGVFNASCAGVLYGDQSVPVCVGKTQSVNP